MAGMPLMTTFMVVALVPFGLVLRVFGVMYCALRVTAVRRLLFAIGMRFVSTRQTTMTWERHETVFRIVRHFEHQIRRIVVQLCFEIEIGRGLFVACQFQGCARLRRVRTRHRGIVRVWRR